MADGETNIDLDSEFDGLVGSPVPRRFSGLVDFPCADKQIGAEGARAIADALKVITTLERLDMDGAFFSQKART